MKYALKKQPTPYSNDRFDFMNNNMTEYLEYFKDLDTIYGRNYIRLSYATSEDIITEAVARIKKALSELK